MRGRKRWRFSFGYTAYAVATMLAVFMGGLAFGSAWLGKRSEGFSNPIPLYGWIELGVALGGAFSLAGLGAVRVFYFAVYPVASGSRVSLLALRFLGAAVGRAQAANTCGGEPRSATLEILRERATLSENQIADAIGHFELAKPFSPNLLQLIYRLAMAEHRDGLGGPNEILTTGRRIFPENSLLRSLELKK